ncbi:MAG: hypothetical protein KC431_27460, partial [Myxococcales bacterium]|nr:hypothetical protein [Myxococcales bacterium]
MSLCSSACTFDNEPTDPCGPLQLGSLHDRQGEQDPAVLVLSDGGGSITVLRSCQDCTAELRLQRIHVGADPEQVLLTGSGRWLTYLEGEVLFSVDLDDADPSPKGGPGDVAEIVGAMRGGDWIVYRTAARGLKAVYVGDEIKTDDEGNPLPRSEYAEVEVEGGPDLFVVALGHRHIVARRLLGEGREELYLIRIAPAGSVDVHGTHERGQAKLLAVGEHFTRVVITEAPSPEPSHAFLADLPIDATVIASSGGRIGSREASAPVSRIYRVSDRTLVDVIEGADIRTSMNALEDISGLQPVSPDGSHFAYITERGSLALHDVESQRSCMLRPARGGTQHVLAGFGADGTLYFESAVDGGKDQVYAHDPFTQKTIQLTPNDRHWRLRAVPPEPHIDEEGVVRPWAIVGFDGPYAVQADHPATPLDYAEINFLQRGSAGLWLLEGVQGLPNLLSLRRIQPELAAGGEGALSFDTKHADPTVEIESSP